MVDFEKFWKTRVYLQRSVPIQPKTSEILPKIGNNPRGPPTGSVVPQPFGGSPNGTSRGSSPGRVPAALNCFYNFFAFFFAIFWRARSRLYQNEILQEKMRLTAFFKLYKICIPLHRCNLKIFAKNRFEKQAFCVKIKQKICKCCKICKKLQIFKNIS